MIRNLTLPKLPVPDLESTLEKYLLAVKPIINESQYDQTKSLVYALTGPHQNGVGPKIQKCLLERREEKDNWAYEWWLNDMYLNVRLPLPIHSNPGMVLPPQEFKNDKDMAKFAAVFIRGVVDHKEKLDRKSLPVERAPSHEKGQPLCMSQYYRLLTSYRVPGVKRDQLFSTLYQGDGSTEHIIVIYKNQLYSLRVKTARGEGVIDKLSIEQITGELLKILSTPIKTMRPVPIGLLTSQKRDIWAVNRENLKQEYQNVDYLEMIEKCLMIVCFDDPLPESFNLQTPRTETNEINKGYKCGNRDETNMMHQMLGGGGSLYNSGNRWFDKTLQLIISKDGVCGFCYEHSPAEGIPVIKLAEDLFKLYEETKGKILENDGSTVPDDMQANKFDWIVTPEIQKSIVEAAKSIDILVEDLDFYVYRYVNYGKDFIKSCNCSPDAYIQMALQLAYYKLYGHLVATYESAGTRRFLLGRVDCIRSATMEALSWVQSMTKEDEEDEGEGIGSKKVTFSLLDDKKKLELFDAAMKRQGEIMLDNILGKGIDIHLLGIREMALESMGTKPEMFDDETYAIANHFGLSTSQLATKLNMFMGYGPVVPDGYGASYNPRNDQIIFCISAFHSCAKTSAWRFARSLEQSLDSMQKLMNSREIDLK
ncbi:Choline O-acetyltransferase, putative [Pediculus humanus corporis]|uniref:Choline O-acetyltransferase n=1 Tax=Pediculus humanus subsp. corporis TaxID=121224 RepID=E0W162_PEDHC|nr:Choline O-acetyltransferase, putative [Pediculus humanus corporis]EEB19368.1 Choline O-acetyltransferase, putative [Pediculus humanus corporis]